MDVANSSSICVRQKVKAPLHVGEPLSFLLGRCCKSHGSRYQGANRRPGQPTLDVFDGIAIKDLMPQVDSVNTMCRVTISAVCRRASRLGARNAPTGLHCSSVKWRLQATTGISKARANRAIWLPILPSPTIPSVLSESRHRFAFAISPRRAQTLHRPECGAPERGASPRQVQVQDRKGSACRRSRYLGPPQRPRQSKHSSCRW
jgi:hypothetical protein